MRRTSRRQRRSPVARHLPLVGLAVVFVAGCTLGPEPERPDTVLDDLESFPGTAAAASMIDEDGGARGVPGSRWWRRIGDPEVDALVDAALEHNTDLQAAAARVLEAEAGLRKAAGSRWPQVSAGASAARVKNSFVLPQAGRVSVMSTNYSDEVAISYVADLFGKLKRSRQAAWANLMATEEARLALEHVVISQVVRARVAVASLERNVELAREIRQSWERTLETVERRYRGGLVAAVDLYLARENLSATRAAEADLAGRLARAGNALDVLVGRAPGVQERPAATMPELPDPEPVPVGLPAGLLDRRPDLRQAERQLSAATYGVGMALADLFPSLSLSASGGTVSDSLSDLLSSDGVVYSAVANLLAPVFNGGQRRAEVDAARARVEQAAAAYSGRILTALREVEDALASEAAAWERLEYAERRVQEARAADRVARARYQRGVEPLLRVLETERRLRTAEEQLLTTRSELWNARIDLHLALGGDWTTKNESAASMASGLAREADSTVDISEVER